MALRHRSDRKKKKSFSNIKVFRHTLGSISTVVAEKYRPTKLLFSLDRLGRNYANILNQWRIITKEKCATIVVLDMPILDSRRDRDIFGNLIADLVLQIMSASSRRYCRRQSSRCPVRAKTFAASRQLLRSLRLVERRQNFSS